MCVYIDNNNDTNNNNISCSILVNDTHLHVDRMIATRPMFVQ